MQIHRVRGKDLTEALERAREAHGDEAVVLSHEKIEGGGVTVSVTDARRDRVRPRRENPELLDPGALAEPGTRDVAERLLAAGASAKLAHDVVEHVRAEGSRGAFAIDTAAAALAERFAVAPSPTSKGVKAIVFVGPTGSGKSTSLGKLALRLKRAGRRVAVASLDTSRPGATAFLDDLCARIGVEFTPVRYREDLDAVLAGSADLDALLIDTAGRSPGDTEHLGQLRRVLSDALGEVDTSIYLALAAATSPEAMEEARRGYAGLEPEALVLTKLDETRRTAPPLEFSRRTDLPVAFLCNGQDVQRDFYRATQDRMADLVLGGRVR